MSNTQGGSVDAKAGQSSGLFAALKNISVTLLTTGKTRLELLGNELEEEKQRAVRLVLMAQGMVFCFGVGALLFVAFVTPAFLGKPDCYPRRFRRSFSAEWRRVLCRLRTSGDAPNACFFGQPGRTSGRPARVESLYSRPLVHP